MGPARRAIAFGLALGTVWCSSRYEGAPDPTASAEAGAPDGSPAEASSDASPSDAGGDGGLSASVLFADSFDDGVALPRSWDQAFTPTGGLLELVSDTGAPTPPGMLRSSAQSTATYLQKALNLGTATKLSCRMKVWLRTASGLGYATAARIETSSGFLWLQLFPGGVSGYANFGNGAVDQLLDTIPVSVESGWVDVSLGVEPGRVSIGASGAMNAYSSPSIGSASPSIAIGEIRTPTQTNVVTFDDVACTAE